MALVSIRARSTLATTEVLAPERYDPRRALDSSATKAVLLGDIVGVVRRVIQPSDALGRCLVLDTSDAREGVVISRKAPVDGSLLGSAKKEIAPRDVIISRLRPYLRQAAFVDDQIPNAEGALLVCSTEFFVLRSRDGGPMAFLVPFLLSRPVQEVLAAAQEGGHHPRFDDATLLTLPVPQSLIDKADAISRKVEQSVTLYREHERGIGELIGRAEEALVEG